MTTSTDSDPPPPTPQPAGWLVTLALIVGISGIGADLIGILTAPIPLILGFLASGVVAIALRKRLASSPAAIAAVMATGVVVAGAAWIAEDRQPEDDAASPVAGFRGGCSPYQIFAQNRWPPLGTTAHAQPNVLSTDMATFPGNKSLSVNGWVHGRAAYPTNTPPWNSDIWFHLTSGIGWVSFAAVRALPTTPDMSGLEEEGGTPAPTPRQCEGALG